MGRDSCCIPAPEPLPVSPPGLIDMNVTVHKARHQHVLPGINNIDISVDIAKISFKDSVNLAVPDDYSSRTEFSVNENLFSEKYFIFRHDLLN